MIDPKDPTIADLYDRLYRLVERIDDVSSQRHQFVNTLADVAHDVSVLKRDVRNLTGDVHNLERAR